MSIISHIALDNLKLTHSIDKTADKNAFQLHCHDDFEVYFFIDGEGYFLIEGNCYTLSPFTLLVIRPGEVHCFKSTGEKHYERYVINFDSDFLNLDEGDASLIYSPFMNREHGKNNLYKINYNSIIVNIFNDFNEISLLSLEGMTLAAKSSLEMLLTKIYLTSKQQNADVGKDSLSSELINEVLKYINENISSQLTLDIIASQFFISKYHLSRLFKKLTGVSVIDYVIRKRVFLSQQLLKGGFTSSQVCVKAGFGDYSAFYRSFKRVVGYSPIQQRTSRFK